MLPNSFHLLDYQLFSWGALFICPVLLEICLALQLSFSSSQLRCIQVVQLNNLKKDGVIRCYCIQMTPLFEEKDSFQTMAILRRFHWHQSTHFKAMIVQLPFDRVSRSQLQVHQQGLSCSFSWDLDQMACIESSMIQIIEQAYQLSPNSNYSLKYFQK